MDITRSGNEEKRLVEEKEFASISLDDLEAIDLIGFGGFGRIELVST